MFNFLYFFTFLKPTDHHPSNRSKMDEIVYQPVDLKNLSFAAKYLASLSEHKVYLCHFRNGSKKFDVALSDPNTIQIMLNKSRKPFDLVNKGEVKFEQFTMNKLQCEFGIDEHLPRKVFGAGRKIVRSFDAKPDYTR